MDALDRVKEQVASDPLVVFATLFGSRAAGRPRPDSDWDVAVYLDPSLSQRERFDASLRIIAALEPDLHVDVVILNDAPPLLAHRALQGKPLLIRDRVTWVRFFVRTLGMAGDERMHALVHAAARRKRLAEGSFGRPCPPRSPSRQAQVMPSRAHCLGWPAQHPRASLPRRGPRHPARHHQS